MTSRPLLAAALVGVGSLCFSLMGLFVKLAARSEATSTFAIVVIRSALGLGFNGLAVLAHVGAAAACGSASASHASPDLSALAGPPSEWHVLEASRRAWLWLALRCLSGFGGILLEYFALRELPLGVTTMIVYSNPAFMVVWAAVFFREPAGPTLLSCLGLSFAGLLLVVRPWRLGTAQHAAWAYSLALGAAVCAGLAYVSLRELRGVRYHVVVSYFLGTCFALAAATGLARGELAIPAWGAAEWRYLLGVSGAAYAAEVCITLGYARAGRSLGRVCVLQFLSPLFSIAWGVLFLGEAFEPMEIAGSALVLSASAAILSTSTAASAAAAVDPTAESLRAGSFVAASAASLVGDHCRRKPDTGTESGGAGGERASQRCAGAATGASTAAVAAAAAASTTPPIGDPCCRKSDVGGERGGAGGDPGSGLYVRASDHAAFASNIGGVAAGDGAGRGAAV